MAAKKLPDDCMPACKSCAFYLKDPKDDLGFCRRYPPSIISIDNDDFDSVFPITTPTEWCGEFIRFVS